MLWRTNEKVRIRERAFGVKRIGVLQANGRACERALCANFSLRGTVGVPSGVLYKVHWALVCSSCHCPQLLKKMVAFFSCKERKNSMLKYQILLSNSCHALTHRREWQSLYNEAM